MSTDTKILLGMKIRNIRDTAKLTQGEFGHIVGIDEKTIKLKQGNMHLLCQLFLK